MNCKLKGSQLLQLLTVKTLKAEMLKNNSQRKLWNKQRLNTNNCDSLFHINIFN